MSGAELRAILNKGKWFWQRWTTASFYLLMAKLEDAGIVQYVLESIDGIPDSMQHPRRRIYSPAEIDKVIGAQVNFITAFGNQHHGRVNYQEGHKLYINWFNKNMNVMQAVRFAHKVQLTGK